MKTLGIIPARGGSKRFPSKNIAIINGKPLIFHTIDAVIGLFDKVIFTSDSDNIIQVVKNEYENYSNENKSEFEINKRPAKLATDTSKVIDTVIYYQEKNPEYEQIWLFLPTCPLRNKNDVINAKKLLTKDVDSVISITEYEFPPSLGLVRGAGGFITSYDYSDPWGNGNTRSQDHPTIHRPNGAVYGTWKKSFVKNKNFYKGKVKSYFMPRSRSADIDTKTDFEIAKALFNIKE